MLSRIPYISTLFRDIEYVDDIDPSAPTDEEVIRALEKQSKDASLSDAFYAGKINVKAKVIIQSYDEPVRFLPHLQMTPISNTAITSVRCMMLKQMN